MAIFVSILLLKRKFGGHLKTHGQAFWQPMKMEAKCAKKYFKKVSKAEKFVAEAAAQWKASKEKVTDSYVKAQEKTKTKI